jgi:hypothetical protein
MMLGQSIFRYTEANSLSAKLVANYKGGFWIREES